MTLHDITRHYMTLHDITCHKMVIRSTLFTCFPAKFFAGLAADLILRGQLRRLLQGYDGREMPLSELCSFVQFRAQHCRNLQNYVVLCRRRKIKGSKIDRLYG